MGRSTTQRTGSRPREPANQTLHVMYMAHVSCVQSCQPSVCHSCEQHLFATPQVDNILQSLLALGPSAANPPSLGALQVLGRDPALVESTSLGTSSDSRAICANNRDLVGRVDLLGSLGRSLSALAALAAPLLLREQSRDPGVVDEVAGAAEGGEEEEVEEDAVVVIVSLALSTGFCLHSQELTSAGRTS
jgi:hypothetical protein